MYDLFYNDGTRIHRLAFITVRADYKHEVIGWNCTYPVKETKTSLSSEGNEFKTLDEAKEFGKNKTIEFLKRYRNV